MLFISNSLCATKSWLNYFSQPFSNFFVHFKTFSVFFEWNQSKNWRKTIKKWKINGKKMILHINQLWGVDKYQFCLFIFRRFCWFQPWNHWKKFKMNKKAWKRQKKVGRPAFGCAQHPKACQNTQQTRREKLINTQKNKLQSLKSTPSSPRGITERM